jgi:hypothetical protein
MEEERCCVTREQEAEFGEGYVEKRGIYPGRR